MVQGYVLSLKLTRKTFSTALRYCYEIQNVIRVKTVEKTRSTNLKAESKPFNFRRALSRSKRSAALKLVSTVDCTALLLLHTVTHKDLVSWVGAFSLDFDLFYLIGSIRIL